MGSQHVRERIPPPKGHAVMITKGTLLRLVVSLTAAATSTASRTAAGQTGAATEDGGARHRRPGTASAVGWSRTLVLAHAATEP